MDLYKLVAVSLVMANIVFYILKKNSGNVKNRIPGKWLPGFNIYYRKTFLSLFFVYLFQDSGIMAKKSVLYTLIIFGFWLSGCDRDDSGNGERYPEKMRTVLVYMAAENSLDSYVDGNIDKMKAGFTAACTGNFLIYLDRANEGPQLLHLYLDKKGMVQQETVLTYPPQNSASAEILGKVIGDVREIFPAASYGLILWSHATGWLPADSPYAFVAPNRIYPQGLLREPSEAPTRAFAQDGADWMELTDLASALPERLFDFILFDACYMGGVEVAYALRSKTSYLIASATEVLAEGFPYDEIMPLFFASSDRYVEMCRKYFDFYNGQRGLYQSATVSLVKMQEMDALADVVRDITVANSGKIVGAGIPVGDIQRFDRFSRALLFDLGDYVERIASVQEYARFEGQLGKTVLYKAATPYFISFPINKFSGLSSYIPQSYYPDLNGFYKTLEWNTSVYPFEW